MLYRIALGVSLQALQQLTGANYFFYYGTVIFKSTGINNVSRTPFSGFSYGIFIMNSTNTWVSLVVW